MITDNLIRGQWKLGKICQVHPGIYGKVRRVSIQYKNKGSDTFITIDRPVQRPVVILPVDEHVLSQYAAIAGRCQCIEQIDYVLYRSAKYSMCLIINNYITDNRYYERR